MKKNNVAILIAGIMLVTALCFAAIAHANPSQIPQAVSTASATTTVVYLTPGTATTTVTFDSYVSGNLTRADFGTLLLQSKASSTSSILNVAIQYSQDNIDWYDNNLSEPATTSAATSISVAKTYTWTAAGTATTSKAVKFDTPIRYSRAVISNTGAGATIWASIVPSKERSE